MKEEGVLGIYSAELAVPNELFIAGVGFVEHELETLMSLASQVAKGFSLRLLELTSISKMLAYLETRQLLDILLLRLGAESSEKNQNHIMQLQRYTQHHVAARLPVIMLVDSERWVDCAYSIGAHGILINPLDTSKWHNFLSGSIQLAQARRRELLYMTGDERLTVYPFDQVCYFRQRGKQASIYLDNGELFPGSSIFDLNGEKPHAFIAINSSVWLNMGKVRYLHSGCAILSDVEQTRLRIAPDKRKAVQKACLAYWRYGSQWKEYIKGSDVDDRYS